MESGERRGQSWITIREMRYGDLEKVMELERDTFETPWSKDFFRSELDRGRGSVYLVAMGRERVVGFIGATVYGTEVHVTNMAVDVEWRRLGVGSALLLDCIIRAVSGGARWATLEVREKNVGARMFYRALGFREIGLRSGYYTDSGENAVLMSTADLSDPEVLGRLEAIHAAIDEE